MKITIALLVLSIAALAFADTGEMLVGMPLAAAFLITTFFFETLKKRDGELPLFDAGAIFCFVMLLYTAVPLFGFLAGGSAFTMLSDSRLIPYDPTPGEIAAFGWRYIVYFATFAIGYLYVRRPIVFKPVSLPGRATYFAIWFWLAVLAGSLFILWAVSGFSFIASYEGRFEDVQRYTSMPLIVQQLSHIADGILQLLKYALLIYLYSNWRRTKRFILLWAAVEIAITLAAFGARTPLLLFLVANALLYHRLVRKFSATKAVSVAVSITAFAFIYGFVRSSSDEDTGYTPILSTSNEFQAMFATGYDVAQRYLEGAVIPWQVYLADLLRLIPQQLLPFQKIDHSDWYLKLIGYDGMGVGFMFGAIAENVISGDWIAFAIRGTLLGLILATIHNWYARRSNRFYPTLVYIWLCLSVYYCFRASMFYIAGWALYLLLPCIALTYCTSRLLAACRPTRQNLITE